MTARLLAEDLAIGRVVAAVIALTMAVDLGIDQWVLQGHVEALAALPAIRAVRVGALAVCLAGLWLSRRVAATSAPERTLVVLSSLTATVFGFMGLLLGLHDRFDPGGGLYVAALFVLALVVKVPSTPALASFLAGLVGISVPMLAEPSRDAVSAVTNLTLMTLIGLGVARLNHLRRVTAILDEATIAKQREELLAAYRESRGPPESSPKSSAGGAVRSPPADCPRRAIQRDRDGYGVFGGEGGLLSQSGPYRPFCGVEAPDAP